MEKDPKRNAFYPTENAGKCGVEREREREREREIKKNGPRQNRNGGRGALKGEEMEASAGNLGKKSVCFARMTSCSTCAI